MKSLDIKQIRTKKYLKACDARWHHHYEFYAALSIELQYGMFHHNSMFMKEFFICNTRCDVCGTDLTTNTNIKINHCTSNKILISINSIYFYIFLSKKNRQELSKNLGTLFLNRRKIFMSIIKPKPKLEREQIRMQIDSQVLYEISRYCEYAGFKKHDEFFEEAALHILSRDKEFKEWKEINVQSINAE